jgi:hypothetical protein
MASTPQGDIPGNRGVEGYAGTVAAVASGGAGAVIGYLGPYPWPIRVRNFWFTPTSANQAATNTASFRQISVYNGGPTGTATATQNRVAILNATASSASFTPIPNTSTVDQTIPSGNLIYFSQGTVGGNDSNGTVLAGGQLSLAYEVM